MPKRIVRKKEQKTGTEPRRYVRIQLDLTEERVRSLDELQHICNIATRKDLFAAALSLFEWCIELARKGNAFAVIARDNKTWREFEIPAFRAARADHPLEPAKEGGELEQSVLNRASSRSTTS